MVQIIEIILILAVVAINFFLSSVIFLKRRTLVSNILFAIVSLWFGLWGLCLLLYQYPIIFTHLFWLRGAYLSATGMELFIVGFALTFPQPTFKKAWPFIVAWGSLFVGATIYGLFFTNKWIEKIIMTPTTGLQTIIGPFYAYWTLGEWVLIAISVIALFYSYQRAKGTIKTQLQYLLVGFFAFGLLVNIPDVFIPLIFHSTSFFSISSILSIIFTGTVSYIILKHRFMDLHRVIRLFFFYFLSILALGGIYFAIAYVLGALFFPTWFNPWYVLAVILFILVMRYSTSSMRGTLERKLKKYFIHGFYEKEEVMQQLISISTQHAINLRSMIRKTLEVIFTTFKPQFVVGISLYEGKIVTFRAIHKDAKAVSPFSPKEISYLDQINEIVVTEELANGETKECLIKRNIAVVMPFHGGKWKRFILLGEKMSQEAYFNYDINTLAHIQPVIQLMAQQGRQVEQIRQFNQQLTNEVARATKNLRNVNASLKSADSLKDEFISIASHELKTPTTAIQGFLWLVLRKDANLSSYSREKIERVSKLTQHITMLVNDMLDVSKLESKRINLHEEQFTLRVLIEEIRDELAILASQKSIGITITTKGDFLVRADRQRIHQVISNLVNNAIKYTENGGNVSVAYKKKDSLVEVSVIDTGIGIRKEDIPKLFMKFGKLDDGSVMGSSMPGSGLGLYITKKLVELSGGDIWITSIPKKGSTFTFTLPLA